MLRLESLCAGYRGLQILHEVDLEVNEGEIVALVGANGAGKTTTLRACSGVIRPTTGQILFDDQPIGGGRTAELVGRGLVHVPEDRALFGPLTIEENLRMGAWTQRRRPVTESLSEVFDLFPILADRRRQTAETLSGGQQQMLTIGRALMARPRLLMLDEPSTGLSPKLTWAVLEAIEVIRDRGVVLSGPGAELAADDRVRAAYLGL
jgi:branched-chain amino acid transport system ATP-binding protein